MARNLSEYILLVPIFVRISMPSHHDLPTVYGCFFIVHLLPRSTDGEYAGIGKKGEANVQMARILQYLECPQYLRKAFFPQHKDLQYAG